MSEIEFNNRSFDMGMFSIDLESFEGAIKEERGLRK
jgi:hypothetical protein